jgi:hypothetical protein
MSKLNGDKSRFQRLRQASLRRRERARVTLAGLRAGVTGAPAASEGAEPGSGAVKPPMPQPPAPTLVG